MNDKVNRIFFSSNYNKYKAPYLLINFSKRMIIEVTDIKVAQFPINFYNTINE